MLKGALLGAGNVALKGHLPAWKDRADVEIVAAADAQPGRLEALGVVLPRARWYGSAEELLAKENLDFVDICAAPSSHAALSRMALDFSLHVLCENPLVLSPEELRGLPSLAAEKERTLFTVHDWKHAPALARVSELVRSGAVGEVRHCRWESLRDEPAGEVGEADNGRGDQVQPGADLLADDGWHALYVLQGWMPTTPRTIAARLSRRRHLDWPIGDTAEVMLFHPSASAEVFLTRAADERANRVELSGTRGRLRLDGGRLTLLDVDGLNMIEEWTFPSLTETSHHPDWFNGVITEFFGEIESPRARGHNLAEAALCANVIALAKESDRRGGEPMSAERAVGPGARR